MPILLGVPILIVTHCRLPITPLVHRLVFIHPVILMPGGQYIYARVPQGFFGCKSFSISVGTTTTGWGILLKASFLLSSPGRSSLDALHFTGAAGYSSWSQAFAWL
jgi:hypothetical protein